MFTIGDIRNIAIQIERNGEETYRNAGKAARDPDIAGILTWMAEEEQNHRRWFETIQSTEPLTQEACELEAMGRTLLQDMLRGNPFLLDQNELNRAESVEDILVRSKIFEQDTIIFYEFLLGLLNDEDTTRQLKRIIGEERNHMRKLEHLEQLWNRQSQF